MVEIRRCRSRASAEQLAFVLAAVGIDCRLEHGDDAVSVCVPAAEAGRAREQLAVYEEENAAGDPAAGLPERASLHGLEAALVYGVVMAVFFIAQRTGALSVDWLPAGAAQAGLIVDGAWWRAFTSLALHADFAHLIANLVFGILAGVMLAQLLGSGIAWFAILLAGGLGNAVNAVIQSADHTAVGASTGVFGALGILSLYRQASGTARWRRGLRRWAPLAAGIMLLAFLGFGGGRTDVMAHVAGFGVGGGLGLALARVPQQTKDDPGIQRICGGLACSLFALAWLVAAYR